MVIKTDAGLAADNLKHRTAWDAATMGFGKHTYHGIDPDTINPDDYARNLNGEETRFGDVRQYNSAFNEMHPENDSSLDWLSRTGTIFVTDAPGFEGRWMVSNMPAVRTPQVYCRAQRVDEDNNPTTEEQEISCVALGCSVDETNNYVHNVTKILVRGKVDRQQRERLTKRV